jgi:hypothetical protein
VRSGDDGAYPEVGCVLDETALHDLDGVLDGHVEVVFHRGGVDGEWIFLGGELWLLLVEVHEVAAAVELSFAASEDNGHSFAVFTLIDF